MKRYKVTAKKIVVYNLELKGYHSKSEDRDNFECSKWIPSLVKPLPPNTGPEYLLLLVAHVFRIFRNRSYSAYQISDNGRVISSLVCVPPLFIWPFMKKNDIQIKAVFTHPDFRGKGLALELINQVIKDFSVNTRTVWYMTHDKNKPSLSLCMKAGFEFAGYYRKNRNTFRFFKIGKLYNH